MLPVSAVSGEPRAEPPIVLSLLAGGFAGAVAKTVVAPFERTKINFQVSNQRHYSLKAAFKFILLTYRNQGLFALWRGHSAILIRIVPFAAAQYHLFAEMKKFLHVDEQGIKTPCRRFVAGSLTGMIATLLCYPLDTARARLAVFGKDKYNSFRSVFVRSYYEGNLRQLYRGITPTFLGIMIYAGTSFSVYDTQKLHSVERNGHEGTVTYRLLSGAMGGLTGQLLSYPLDIIRRRMQTGNIPHGQSVLETLRKIYKHEGFRHGLYKGVSMNFIKGPIVAGLSLTINDYARHYLADLTEPKGKSLQRLVA